MRVDKQRGIRVVPRAYSTAFEPQDSLYLTEIDRLSIQPVFGRADFAAADHRLSAYELAARDEPHRPATRTGPHGDERVLRMTHTGLIFQDENRARVHSFGDPFFQKLQVG
jgi:hypothetical protein